MPFEYSNWVGLRYASSSALLGLSRKTSSEAAVNKAHIPDVAAILPFRHEDAFRPVGPNRSRSYRLLQKRSRPLLDVEKLEFQPRLQFRKPLIVSMEFPWGLQRSDRSFCVRPSLRPCYGSYVSRSPPSVFRTSTGASGSFANRAQQVVAISAWRPGGRAP
jgi:hypothetical protein